MNIVEIVGLNGPNGAESGKTEMKFAQKANFKLEILPSIFKAREFAGFDIVWLEPGVNYTRGTGSKTVEKPVRIPVRICSSGFSESIAENIRYAFTEGGCIVTLSDGKAYRITLLTNVKSTEAEDGENDSGTNEGKTETRPNNSSFKAVPVREGEIRAAAYAFAAVPESERVAPSKLSSAL